MEFSYVGNVLPQPFNTSVVSDCANEAVFLLQIKMQSPILSFPKYPGSFEMLIANLGQITIQNDHKNRCDLKMWFWTRILYSQK